VNPNTPSRSSLTIFYASVFFIVTSLINWAISFPLVIFSNLRAGFNFADLFSTLSTVDCYSRIGLDVYSSQNSGYCGNYIYGADLLSTFNILRLNPEFSTFIGIIFIVSVSSTFAIFLITSSTSKTGIALGTVLFFSPGVSLLFERGNIDALVFVGLVASGVLAKKNRFYSSFAILGILSVLKFYTFPCMLVYLLLQKNSKKRIFGSSLIIVVFARIIFSLSKIESAIPEGGYAQFGAKIIGNYFRGLGLPVSYLQGRLIAYISIVLICFFLLTNRITKAKLQQRLLQRDDLLTPGFFCAVTFISCYILGLNYDYRLVFFAPFVIWLLEILYLQRTTSYVFISISLFGAWFSTGLGSSLFIDNLFWQRYIVNFFQAIGDVSIWLIVSVSISLAILSVDRLKVLFKSGKVANVS